MRWICPIASVALLLLTIPATTTAAPSTVSDEIKAALVARGVPLTFSDPIAGPAAVALAGYVPSHGWVAFKGEGVAYGRPPTDGPFDLHNPPVLLYRPIPSGAFSDQQLSDQSPEPGYELVGVAYFQNYYGSTPIEETPPEAPPSLDPLPGGLRPSGAWFRHTAGCHMSSGEFVAFSENLPDPGLDALTRVALGTSWCQAVGINSNWVADPGVDVELGAAGRCLLDRNLNPPVGSPRPVRPGSFARMSAPDTFGLPRPPDPGSPPAVVNDPGPPPPFGSATPDQILAFNTYTAAKATYDSAVSALEGWRSGVAAAATANCQSIGTSITPPNGPTFWHGMAWDTHLFFESAGTSVAGVNDIDLVPNGYVGPPFSFAPGDGALLSVAFAPPPTVSAGGPYFVESGGSVSLTASIGTSTAPVVFAWDLDGSGTFQSSGQTVTFTSPFDAPPTSTFAVTARACAMHGACTSSSTIVQVSDVNGPPGGGPTPNSTPELDSLLLFVTGVFGLGSYAAMYRRSRRNRKPMA